jgi:hypothetical protein
LTKADQINADRLNPKGFCFRETVHKDVDADFFPGLLNLCYPLLLGRFLFIIHVLEGPIPCAFSHVEDPLVPRIHIGINVILKFSLDLWWELTDGVAGASVGRIHIEVETVDL